MEFVESLRNWNRLKPLKENFFVFLTLGIHKTLYGVTSFNYGLYTGLDWTFPDTKLLWETKRRTTGSKINDSQLPCFRDRESSGPFVSSFNRSLKVFLPCFSETKFLNERAVTLLKPSTQSLSNHRCKMTGSTCKREEWWGMGGSDTLVLVRQI